MVKIKTKIVAVLTGKNNSKKGMATIAKPKLLAPCTILLIKIIKNIYINTILLLTPNVDNIFHIILLTLNTYYQYT